VAIERVVQITPELMAAFDRLLPQLSPSTTLPDAGQLNEIIAAPGTQLFIARDAQGEIVGALTLVLYRTPMAMHAWIEDVVVDEKARGQGYGAALNMHAIEQARAAGARNVHLTSRPARVAANRLYQKLGFVRWETNAYRYDLKK